MAELYVDIKRRRHGKANPAEAGLLRASLVPPKSIRDLRDLTRYGKARIGDGQRGQPVAQGDAGPRC